MYSGSQAAVAYVDRCSKNVYRVGSYVASPGSMPCGLGFGGPDSVQGGEVVGVDAYEEDRRCIGDTGVRS